MNHYASNLKYLMRTCRIQESYLRNELRIRSLDRPHPDEILKIAQCFNVTADMLLGMNLNAWNKQRSKDIKMIIFDIDGVMTDSGLYYGQDGTELKKFNAKDGHAIRELNKKGILAGIISHGNQQDLVERRAQRLGIEWVEVSDVPKRTTLFRWCADLYISPDQVCFIGDDNNDESIMKVVGFAACPADASDQIKSLAHVVLSKKGGEGCIRELIDLYL